MAKGRRRAQENIGQQVLGTMVALISWTIEIGRSRRDRKAISA